MCKCIRCGKELKSEESKKRGYGPTCYKIVSYSNKKKWKLVLRRGINTLKYRRKREIIIKNIINTPEVKTTPIDNEFLDRIRKLELDYSYLKARDKNRTTTMVNASPHDSNLERIKQEEAAKITDPTLKEFRSVFREVVSELKDVLKLRKEKIESGEIDISKLTLVRE